MEIDVAGYIKKINRGVILSKIIKHGMINILNPETLILNSELLRLFPEVETNIRLKLSELGTNACVMGACALAIKKYLKIPELSLSTAAL